MNKPTFNTSLILRTMCLFLCVLWLSLMSTSIFAQDANTLFVAGNKLYQQEKYNEAIEKFSQVEGKKTQSADLFYNLANAYYRTNQVAPAVFYYEKALQLAPNNKDILVNLEFAKRMTIDNIETLPTNLGQKFSINFIQKLSFNSWAIIAVLLSILFAILFLLYHFYSNSIKKRLFFISGILSFLLMLVSLLFAFQTYKITTNKKEAIVFAQQTQVKKAPILSSDDAFQLHEGTKVTILKSVDNWKKIRIANGQIGWIIDNELKVL